MMYELQEIDRYSGTGGVACPVGCYTSPRMALERFSTLAAAVAKTGGEVRLMKWCRTPEGGRVPVVVAAVHGDGLLVAR